MGEVGESNPAPWVVGWPGAERAITLVWEQRDFYPGTVTELWSSPDLENWTLALTNSAGTVTLPADKPAEFFKIRNRDTLGQVSDWAR